MSETIKKYGMGWRRDYPEFRDYTIESSEVSLRHKRLEQKDPVKVILKKTGVVETAKASLPSSIDLRSWCSPIEDQETIGSCTAHAGIGIVEYFERRAFGRHIDASRLFLYKVTRNLLKWQGDTGAYLRTTMSALVLFGVPPEEHWPYRIADFEEEPSAFCYAYAQNYQAIKYYRLDPLGTSKDALLNRIKTNLAAGLPSMFGFTVYSSISQADTSGKIPYPVPNDDFAGGHAVVAVGYDDTIKIKNNNVGGVETTGALLIRNSWGTGWGESGYGWLPYDYVLKGLAVDWWSLIKNEWVDTGKFKL
ncbi:MAG: cysteine protease [Candidatus Brocadia sp.]|nr:cysteine protease [Candidatus Brocadia sp.]